MNMRKRLLNQKTDKTIKWRGAWARKPTPLIKFEHIPNRILVHMTWNGVEYGLGMHKIRGRTNQFMRKALYRSLMNTLCAHELRDMKTIKRIYGL